MIMVEERSLKLPLGHPLVEKLCYLSLIDKVVFKEKPNFKEEVPEKEQDNFKEKVLKEYKNKFKKEVSFKDEVSEED
ncbi:hypothetical protein HMPREF1391_01425 [Helicobacter pylori GAM100Ai]|uniref:Uncharacterized protein n=1 Tax=Helicobacter pylori GAM100Ai TaxID=1159019 RepID=A0AB72ZTA3_HELPX|nr:hypothetical protein HMPREF1391_01425 [Helicobacter pylori GAM100Ai]